MSAARLPRLTRWLYLVAVLLLAAAWRFSSLDAMRAMLHHDEAAYGVDALSLIEQPRLQVYFPANNGREGLWMWLLTPLLSVWRGEALPLRVTAALVGVLTVAAAYALARELFRRRPSAAWFAALALALQFWHALHSHHAFRAITFPLLGALALAALLRAARVNRACWWVAAGVCAGLAFHTYIAARFWMLGMAALLAWWFARRAPQRRGIAVCALVWGIVCAPLVVSLVQTPQTRIDQVAITSLDQLSANLRAWFDAVILNQPINDSIHYSAGGSLWSLPGAALALLGVALLLREPGAGAAALVLAALSILPAALTERPITLLRALGLTIPLALVVGAGAAALWQARRAGRAAAVGLIALVGWQSGDMLARYVRDPALIMPMEMPLYGGIDWLAAHPAPGRAYVAPFSADHPVLQFRQTMLAAAAPAPRPVTAFDPAVCLRLSPEADYFAIAQYTPDLPARLGEWGDVTLIHDDGIGGLIWRARPAPSAFDWRGIVFGEQIEAQPVDAPPGSAGAGETVALRWRFRRIAPLDRHLTAFVHVYDADSLTLRAQTDAPLCPANTPMDWGADEVIIQTFALALPPELPPGTYRLAFGVYESALDGGAAGARLRPEPGAYAVESDALIVQPALTVEAG